MKYQPVNSSLSLIDGSNLEEFCPLGYNAMQSTESQSTFRRNMAPPSRGSRTSACDMLS
jgi:hypothetical protein